MLVQRRDTYLLSAMQLTSKTHATDLIAFFEEHTGNSPVDITPFRDEEDGTIGLIIEFALTTFYIPFTHIIVVSRYKNIKHYSTQNFDMYYEIMEP